MVATYKKPGAKNISRVDIAWVSASDGSATVATQHVTGTIRRVVFDPAAAALAPSAAYDLTLTDEHGVDVLAGQGANLSETTTTHVVPGVPLKDETTVSVVPIFVDGVLTLNVTNAGDANAGVVSVYLE